MTGKDYMEMLNFTEDEWMTLCFEMVCDLMEANTDVLKRLKDWSED